MPETFLLFVSDFSSPSRKKPISLAEKMNGVLGL